MDITQKLYLQLTKTYIKNAKTRNIEWDLSHKEAIDLFRLDCYYCGLEPSNVYSPYNDERYKTETHLQNLLHYNGIDRIDNNKGYFLMNCVPCCKTCNYAKRDMSLEEFENWIDRIIEYKGK